MCGICGVFSIDGAPVAPATIEAMSSTISHRGPDDTGVYIQPGIGLGFRRLSVIDLHNGHQPMCDSTGEVWVVFNGEIYNFVELRRELEARGHRFRTRSDTEVIVHGYREWGETVLDRLNGMFGLAIWDARRRQLMVARDRAGIKPLYWAVEDGRLVFGSEIRAVLAGLERKPAIDPMAFAEFLQFRYTPAPSTMYSGVRKLPPGGRLIADESGIRQELWWTFRPEPFDPAPPPDEAADELYERYAAAVTRQLVSDVPVGILLSGGLDSGLLLALMSRAGSEWPAFSVGFGSAHAGDELLAAADTARVFGARHETIRLDRATFESSLPEVVASLEEPIASPSVVPMYHVSRRAREDVKVVLTGQGPDELFGGYRRHQGVRYGTWWRALPASVRRLASNGVAALPRAETLKRGVEALGDPDPARRRLRALSIEPAAAVAGLFQAGAIDVGGHDTGVWASGINALAGGADELSAFQYLEIRSTLPDELLLYADKLSMRHGLEARVPFLDQDVIEYALRLPPHYKVRHGRRKWLHRQVCSRFLPPEIVRRPKRGFAVDVVDDWYRSSIKGLLDETVLDPQSRIYDLLEPAAVARVVDEHRAGRHDRHKLLHSLVVAELWMRAFA